MQVQTKIPMHLSPLAGLCFVLAALSSILGLALYAPLLEGDDFLSQAAENKPLVILGALCELILVTTALGTGILLSINIKKKSPALGLGYLCFRLLEAVFIMCGLLALLTALSICVLYANNGMPKEEALALASGFKALHKWTFMLGPNFMLAINTFLYSLAFWQLRSLPRPMAFWGLLSSALVMLAALLELFGAIEQLSLWGILLAAPIALYEMSLAYFLIRRRVFLPL